MTRADNCQYLITAARARANSTRERTTTALQSMVDHDEVITFETAAARAGVSRSWLHNSNRRWAHSARNGRARSTRPSLPDR